MILSYDNYHDDMIMIIIMISWRFHRIIFNPCFPSLFCLWLSTWECWRMISINEDAIHGLVRPQLRNTKALELVTESLWRWLMQFLKLFHGIHFLSKSDVKWDSSTIAAASTSAGEVRWSSLKFEVRDQVLWTQLETEGIASVCNSGQKFEDATWRYMVHVHDDTMMIHDALQ